MLHLCIYMSYFLIDYIIKYTDLKCKIQYIHITHKPINLSKIWTISITPKSIPVPLPSQSLPSHFYLPRAFTI